MKFKLAYLVACILLATAVGFGQASVALSPVANQQFLDSNGTPVVGGKLFTYISGTTTPLATYKDSTGTVQNTNPIILDASGRATIWLVVGSAYRFRLQDALGNLIWQEDGVTTLSLANGGVMGGTFSGNPIFAGNPTFSGNPIFSGVPSFTNGGALSGSFSGNPAFAGSPTVTGNGTNGVIALPVLAGQAYNVKAYGAVGDDTADDTTAIQNTINAMPSCTQAGSTWTHCGKAYMPRGVYKITSALTVSSPFVYLVGESTGAVTIDAHLTTGCAVQWTANPYNSGQPQTNSGGLFNLTIDGTNAAAGTCGLETFDINGLKARGLSIANFTGAGSIGWWDNIINYWNERLDVQAEIANNTTDWKLQNSHTSGTGNTFGYGRVFLTLNANSGQTAITSVGINSTYGVGMNNEIGNIIINAISGATCASLTAFSDWNYAGDLHCEGATTGFTTDATSYLYVFGNFSTAGANSGNILAFTQNQLVNADFMVKNYNPATSGTAASSPVLSFHGNYWNGSASAEDIWDVSGSIGSGANGSSTLFFTHSGSSGAAMVELPKVEINLGGQIISAAGAPSGACTTGSIYMNTSGGSGTTLYACVAAAWVDVK